MIEMEVLGRSGHEEIKWNPEVEEEVKNAEAKFNELKKKGYFFAIVGGDNEGTLVDTFDKMQGALTAHSGDHPQKGIVTKAKKTTKKAVAAPPLKGG